MELSDPLAIAAVTLCLGLQTAALLIGFALLIQMRYHVTALNTSVRELATLTTARTGETVDVPAPMRPDADAPGPALPDTLSEFLNFRPPKPWGVK